MLFWSNFIGIVNTVAGAWRPEDGAVFNFYQYYMVPRAEAMDARMQNMLAFNATSRIDWLGMSLQDMKMPHIIYTNRKKLALVAAFVATCVFGRMSFSASTSLFENPEPSTFEQLAGLWACLYTAIPALLIGMTFTHYLVPVAGIVNMLGGAVLLATEYRSSVPVGAQYADTSTHIGMGIEIGISVVIAIIAALVVKAVFRLVTDRLAQRKTLAINSGG
jgi:hypothetical protein